MGRSIRLFLILFLGFSAVLIYLVWGKNNESIQILSWVLGIVSGLVAVLDYLSRSGKQSSLEDWGDVLTGWKLFDRLSDDTKKVLLSKAKIGEWNDYFLWSERCDRVLEAIRGRGRALVLGVSGLGKSRLLIEVLRKLARDQWDFKNAYYVFVNKTSNIGNLVAPSGLLGRKFETVILFFDDFDQYVGIASISDVVSGFEEVYNKLVVVGTCRSEVFPEIEHKSDVTTIFSKKDIIRLPIYRREEGEKIAEGVDKPFPEDFDGTASHIVLDRIKKEEYYTKLVDNEKAVLRAVKLLRLCTIPIPKVEHVMLVWDDVFHTAGDWNTCFDRVRRQEFFWVYSTRELPEVVLIPDVYIDPNRGFVKDYPSHEKQMSEHIQVLKEVFEREKADEELFYLGNYFYEKGTYEQALECYNSVINITPNNPIPYNNRGAAYSRLGEDGKAVEDCTKALELKPDYPDAYNNRGNAYSRLGEHGKAVEDYNKAIELKHDYPEAYNNRGVAYSDLGEHGKAVEDYNKAIELKPDYPDAYNNRGAAYSDLGEHDKAISDFDSAWIRRKSLADVRARIPLSALLLLLVKSKGRILKKDLEQYSLWIERAKEVYNLLPEDQKKLVDELNKRVEEAKTKRRKTK